MTTDTTDRGASSYLTPEERSEIVRAYNERHRPKPQDARRLQEWVDRERSHE